MNSFNVLGQDAHWVLNKKIVKKVGVQAALLLSDIISKRQYFLNRGEVSDGWFFNTVEDVEKDTTLSKHDQTKAIKKLSEVGFLKTKNKGVPPRRHFCIDDAEIFNFLAYSPVESPNGENLDIQSANNSTFESSNFSDIINKNKENKNKENNKENNKKKTSLSLEDRKEAFKKECIESNKESKTLSEFGLENFIDFWTEHNASGSKMKFEKTSTFNINLRIKKWGRNAFNPADLYKDAVPENVTFENCYGWVTHKETGKRTYVTRSQYTEEYKLNRDYIFQLKQ